MKKECRECRRSSWPEPLRWPWEPPVCWPTSPATAMGAEKTDTEAVATACHGMGMMHSSAGHLIRHLLKHEKEIGLSTDQVTKLKDIQLNLDKTRIKSEADIQVAERELKALTDDEKSDLGAIEAKLKQSEELQVALRMTSIKTRREVLAC